MPQIIGNAQSRIVNGRQETVFTFSALSENTARRKAVFNSRVKGLAGFEIISVEDIGPGDLPGQREFEVTVVSQR